MYNQNSKLLILFCIIQKNINNLNFKIYIFTPLNFYLINFAFINLNIFYTTKNVIQNLVNLNF